MEDMQMRRKRDSRVKILCEETVYFIQLRLLEGREEIAETPQGVKGKRYWQGARKAVRITIFKEK